MFFPPSPSSLPCALSNYRHTTTKANNPTGSGCPTSSSGSRPRMYAVIKDNAAGRPLLYYPSPLRSMGDRRATTVCMAFSRVHVTGCLHAIYSHVYDSTQRPRRLTSGSTTGHR